MTDPRDLIKRLADSLHEAAGEVEGWGNYASSYFQEKHDLRGNVARIYAEAAEARAYLAQPEPEQLPQGYIDPEHKDQERELLEVFYRACRSEGGTADEIHLRGIKAVLANAPLAQPEPPSLKEEALAALGPEPLPETGPTGDTILNKGKIECHRIIRRALEQLPASQQEAG